MKPEINHDITMLQQCLGGNPQAFEALVGKYQSLVCAVTYSATGKADVSEDLAQETFIQAWKNLGQLQEPAKFRSWLLSIAKRCILNHYRKTRQTEEHFSDPDIIDDQPASEACPAEKAVSKEEEAMVGEAMMRLPKHYRVPMVLFYRQRHSVCEVAEILGQSEATVRVHLHRGRQMLKDNVESMIDRTLQKTAPTKAFTGAVIAAIGLSAAGKAAAASTGTSAASSGGTLSTLIGSTAAKITAAAAAVILTASAVFMYTHQSHAKAENTSPTAPAAAITNESAAVPVEPVADPPVMAAEPVQPTGIPAEPAEIILPQPETLATTVPVDKTKPRVERIQEEGYIFEAKGVLSGLITDIETGEPVTDAEVVISSGMHRTKTDENGFYSFEKIDKDGNSGVAVYSTEYIGITDYEKRLKIHLARNDKAVQHFQLAKACMIDVYVVDADGEPVKDVRLWTTSLGEEHGREVGRNYVSQSTNADGYLRLGGFAPSPFQYQVNAMHLRYGTKWITKDGRKYKPSVSDYAPGHVKVTLNDPNLIEYSEIVLQKGTTVQGIAKYADGTPAKECQIVPYPDWWHSNFQPPSFEIDPNGLFTLEQIVPGSYRIQASIPTGPSSSIRHGLFSKQLPLENGELLEVTITQKPQEAKALTDTDRNVQKERPKLFGMVVDADTQQPIARFQMRADKLRGGNYVQPGRWTQYNDKKGTFSIDVVAEAVYKVQVAVDGYAAAWSGEIDTGDNTAVLIKLTRGGSISGRVVDAAGKPVAGAAILPGSTASAIKPSGERVFESEVGVVTTDAMGQFTLKNLAEGAEILKITHPDYTYAMVEDIQVKTGCEHRIGTIVLHTGGTVEGVFCGNDGKPQGGVTLYAQNHSGFSTSEIKYGTVVTEPNGFYRFEHLPEEMVYLVRPRSYEQTGVVSCGFVPTGNACTQLDLGKGPMVRGRLAIDGKPLANTRMLLEKGHWCSYGLYRCHADTDANGNFSMAAGGPGRYTLSYDRRGKYFTSLTTKLLDVEVGTTDIALGTVPQAGKTLRLRFEMPEPQENQRQYFSLKENNAFTGICVYWQDEPKTAEMPYEINGLKAGVYYVAIQLGTGCEYLHRIEITDEDDILDVTVPIVKGPVTVTGILPEGINHAFLVNEAQTVSSILYNGKDGGFRIENMPAGRYRVNPKWQQTGDGITIDIPEQEEFSLNLSRQQLLDMLKEQLSIKVFDENGQPAENAKVWIECRGQVIEPTYRDAYSGLFYLDDDEYLIVAEKGSLKARRPYRVHLDKNNTASGELMETFIQLENAK